MQAWAKRTLARPRAPPSVLCPAKAHAQAPGGGHERPPARADRSHRLPRQSPGRESPAAVAGQKPPSLATASMECSGCWPAPSLAAAIARRTRDLVQLLGRLHRRRPLWDSAAATRPPRVDRWPAPAPPASRAAPRSRPHACAAPTRFTGPPGPRDGLARPSRCRRGHTAPWRPHSAASSHYRGLLSRLVHVLVHGRRNAPPRRAGDPTVIARPGRAAVGNRWARRARSASTRTLPPIAGVETPSCNNIQTRRQRENERGFFF